MTTLRKFFAVCLVILYLVSGLTYSQTDSTKKDFKRIDVLPAISYSPETKLTLGAIGFYYMDLSRGKDRASTSISNFNFLAVYTTANQIAIEGKAELFLPGNKWRIRGETFYNKYPDRNYGIGNNADAVFAEYRDKKDGIPDTVNYLSVNTDRLKFSPVIIRELRKNFYLGLQIDGEYIYNYYPLYNYKYVSGDSSSVLDLPVEGMRSGIGFQLLYDSRDNILNPRTGAYVEFGDLHYGRFSLSDFTFNSYRLDARKYINPVLNHTLALRSVVNYRNGKGDLPARGLSRVGGKDFIRGYFQGTYEDKSLLAFEAEYRLPLWRDETESSLWQLWKRLGVVVFAGTAQVVDQPGDLRLNRFRTAAGGGLRILFSRQSRVNLRIDYAVGFAPDSDGPGKRQTGLYFFLSEAF